jgi:hypothetical protein
VFAGYLIPVVVQMKDRLKLIFDAADDMPPNQHYIGLARDTLMLPEPSPTMNLIENASFLPIELRMHVPALFAHISIYNQLVREAPKGEIRRRDFEIVLAPKLRRLERMVDAVHDKLERLAGIQDPAAHVAGAYPEGRGGEGA